VGTAHQKDIHQWSKVAGTIIKAQRPEALPDEGCCAKSPGDRWGRGACPLPRAL